MAELLVHIGNATTNPWQDGDVVQAVRTYDCLRVHAETISRGRSVDVGAAQSALKLEYDKYTKDKGVQLPSEADLSLWWDKAEAEAGLNRTNFETYPFTALERRRGMVIPLDADISVADQQAWAGTPNPPDFVPRYVDWRTDIIVANRAKKGAGGPAAVDADVLDKSIHVVVDVALPVGQVLVRP